MRRGVRAACVAAFLLLCAGVSEGRPPWKLLLLIFAAAALTVDQLVTGFGSYFFSPPLLKLMA